MAVAATSKLELGTDYQGLVMALSPLVYWRLDEPSGTSAIDLSGNAYTGTYTGSAFTQGVSGAISDENHAVSFDGTDGNYVTSGDVSALRLGGPMTVMCWMKKDTAATGEARYACGNRDGTNDGWIIGSDASEKFSAILGNGSTQVTVTDTGSAHNLDEWYCVVLTYATPNIELWVNGVSADTGTITGPLTYDAAGATVVGHYKVGGTNDWVGDVDEFAMWGSVLSDADILELYTLGPWFDATADLLAFPAPRISYGIRGNGPLDRTASTGRITFSLNNSATNSAATAGYYSPLHASKRVGFSRGSRVRYSLAYSGTTYYKFNGKLSVIDPRPGQYKRQETNCVALDWMEEAATFQCRDVAPQIDQTSDQLVTACVDSMPGSAQPVSRSFDTGLQVVPYAFHDIGTGEPALQVLAKIVQTDFTFLAVIGDTTSGGKLMYFDRHSRANVTSSATLNETMVDLKVPTSLDAVYNDVQVTTHRLVLDTELVQIFKLETGGISDRLSVAPGETLVVDVEYRDPNDDSEVIGAFDGQTPNADVPATAANDVIITTGPNTGGDPESAPEADQLQDDFTITYEYFASKATVTLTNNSAVFGYLRRVVGRGKGIYDYGDLNQTASSGESFGSRFISIDMPYQGDGNVGLGIAEFVLNQYKDLNGKISTVKFDATTSDALMTAALAREPGDKITVTETMTGTSSAVGFIQNVNLQILHAGKQILCEWGIAPDVEGDFWILGTDQLGTGTTLGYA